MKKDYKDLMRDINTIAELSVYGCEGEFHIFPFVILYLYAHERIEFVKVNSLDEIKETIIIYKDLCEAFRENRITQEELVDYNNINYYVLTTQNKAKSKTDVIIQFTIKKILDIIQEKGFFSNISDAMFKLYNLLSIYSPSLIKKELESIYLKTMDFLFFFTTPIQDYYKIRNLKNCKELSRLMIELLTIEKKDAYSIVHPMAGPANFIEYLNNNVTYQTSMKDCRFICLYQLFSDVVEKKVELLPYSTNNKLDFKKKHIIFDDISVGYKVWKMIAQTALTAKLGIFYLENDTLYEFNNRKLCNGVDGIELLKKHIDYVIFLPEGKTLVSVCDKKNNENVILVDESHSKVICAKTVLNDIACFNNTYVLTPEEYSSPYFVFDENRILSKRIKSINGNEEKILLKDVLYPSNEVGFSLCKWEIETFDYDYSRFNPYYVLDNYSLISKTEIEAKETNSKCVLLLDLITKQKFQPKIFYYDKFEHSLSMDESAYHIKEGIVDFGYLINEMNKKYFIDQIFPTDVKVDAALEWSDLGQCYIKFPDTHNTATPIERQKILLNEEKMEFINKILRNYDYDVEKIIKGNKANLKKNTILNGHYRIVGFLGSGGFGKTYKAIRTNEDNSETIVAIKEFFDCVYQKRAKDSNEVVNLSNDIKNIVEVRNKFFTEAKKIQKFAHCENIVKVHEVFDENNTSYYSMEYIDGYNLLDYVKEKGKLLEKEAIRIIRGVANALKAMHNESMLHMDVKPGNIMIGKNGRVVLIDFGGAHKYNASFQKNTTLVNLNSPGFTPPELIGSYRFSPAYDIYSLGATLHFMLLGDIPNNGSGESRISTNINNSSMLNELPNDISEKAKECIGKSMNSSPNYRPQTIDEFLAMLPGE